MGLLKFLSSKRDVVDSGTSPSVDTISDEEFRRMYIDRDSRVLTRLRHAMIGYGNPERETTTFHSCTCGDEKPCIHMYRLALDSGRIKKAVGNPEIENLVRGMRNALYEVFTTCVHGGYYECGVHRWSHSKITFKELTDLGIISGDLRSCAWTPFFLDNIVAFIYYVYTDPRNRSVNRVTGFKG